jgi:hypothetical protein
MIGHVEASSSTIFGERSQSNRRRTFRLYRDDRNLAKVVPPFGAGKILLPIEIAQKMSRRGLKQLFRMIRRRLRQDTKVLAFMLTAFRVQAQPKEHAEVVLRAR